MKQLNFENVVKLVEQCVNRHSCSDFGKKPFQIIGIYFNPDDLTWHTAVEVEGQYPNSLYFRINGRKPQFANNGWIEKVDYFVPGSQARYTTWINSEYKPFYNNTCSKCIAGSCGQKANVIGM